jgi:hypothetical protein
MIQLSDAWRMPWSTLFGAVIGIIAVLVTPTIIGPLRDVYDTSFPVLSMSGEIVERTEDSVIFHIKGRKLRGEECRLLAVYGYAVDKYGRLTDATATRIDMKEVGRPRDVGLYDIGLWRIKPVYMDSVAVKVITQHDCVGRVVLSTIAEASL